MALNVDDLLKPISDDLPSGEDLTYDAERHQIEQAFESGEFGADAEVEIDWRVIIKKIEQQLGKTKDVWLPAYLCRAGARSGSLETVEAGAQVLAGLFEQFWDTVHPQLDELGLPGRKAPCDALTSRKDFLGPMERVILVAHPRMGAFNGLDFERFRSGAEAEDGYGMFRAAIDDLGDSALVEAIGRLDRIEDGLRRADKVFTLVAAGEPSPNYAPTYALLATLRQAVQAFIVQPEVIEDEPVEDVQTEGGAPVKAAAKPKISGAVESREDVVRALDAIAEYYRKQEPSHPVQFALARAKSWVAMDFMELLKDIAPDSLGQAEMLLNKRSGS